MHIFEVEHSFDLELGLEKAWEFLWDVKTLPQCIPGCDEVITIEEEKIYKARVHRKVGPFLIRFTLDVSVLEHESPNMIVVRITGEDKKLRSKIIQTMKISLIDIGNNHSNIKFATTIELSGILASLGKKLIMMHMYQIINESIENIRTAINAQVLKDST